MTRREREDAEMWMTLLVVSLVVAACLAWIAPVVEMLSPNLKPDAGVGTVGAESTCGNCGVIEEVRDFGPAASRREGTTVTGGHAGVVMIILVALGGNVSIEPARIYEVQVRMQDGSVRTFQSATPSARKHGDRVKVVRGRIEQVS
jgi:hypothetical protein